MKRTLLHLGFALAAVSVAACESTKSANPLSPTVAGPIPGVNISPPRLLEPTQGFQVDNAKQPITLLVENAATSGVRPLFYTFEVATDAGFKNKVFSQTGVPQGEGGRTSLRLPSKLAAGRTYRWRAMAQDGANSGSFTAAVTFQVIVPVVIHPPAPLAPVGGATVSPSNPSFRFAHAPTSGPAGKLSYRIEVALNDAFTQMLAVLTIPESSGDTTTFKASLALPSRKTIFWRIRGFNSKHMGPWSATQAFKSSAPAPTGGGGGGGGTPASCSPTPSEPIEILRCHRAKYGNPFTDAEHVSFLRGSMRDFNRKRISGYPFGILRKEGGNNCGGYSCDVVCSGQGSSQKQWDVLRNEDVPTWGSPLSGRIRVDVCVAP